jgi:DNA-binding transcriptional regulator YiaG
MTTYDVSREKLIEELKRDIEAGKPLTNSAYKVRVSKPMTKEEFSAIRKDLDYTQAQLAEILDISIKTVQSYEQGRIEAPGLVAKVLRLLRSNSRFKTIFQGDIDPKEYSDSAELMYVNNEMFKAGNEFVETMNNAYDKLHTTFQIQNMTGPSNSISLQIPIQNEVKNER